MTPVVKQTKNSIVVKLANFQISQNEADKEGFWGTPYISVNAHVLEYQDLTEYSKGYQLAVRILGILARRANLPLNSVVYTNEKIGAAVQRAIFEAGHNF